MKRAIPLTLFFLLTMGLAWGLTTYQAPAATPPSTHTMRWVVRAYFDDPLMVNQLAAWKEPWEVHYDQGYLVVDVTPAEHQRLQAAGFRLEIDTQRTGEINVTHEPQEGGGIPGFPCYRTVEETFASAEALAASYSTLATWTDVGDSWEKTQNPALGYDMKVLRLTNAATPGPKPSLLITAAIHAREYTTAELATRFAEYLLANYGVDPDVTWLLDHHQIHLVLHTNPDGRKLAELGELWRKNTDDDDGCTTYPLYGVDLNRNFNFQWGCCGGSSPFSCDETYRGPSAGSEPESQAVMNYMTSIFPDQREPDLNAAAPITATGVYIDLHSYAQEILWPWGFTGTPAPNGAGMQTLARKMGYINGYAPTQSLYTTDGTTKDFVYGELGVAGYTIELGTNFFQDCSSFENTVLPDNLPVLLYAAKASRTPYITPSGPDAVDVALSEAAVAAGQVVTLTATIDDTRFNNSQGTEPTQDIAAAEYYVDTPPWITVTLPISLPLSASDGSFDETVEAVEGIVDTTGLAIGRHTLFVRGQDADGNWGAITAVFLYVVDPAVSPTIEGYVREAETNLPLAATVSAGALFQTDTDPSTGFYQMLVISGTYDLTAEAADHGSQTFTGIQAHNYQTIQQDFSLQPTCAAFEDDVESGNVGWTAQSPWAIVTESSHSPTHSWTDSPGGNYSNNRNVSLTSPIMDLTDFDSVTLTFWQICDTEAGWDYCHVEVSDNGGASWSEIATFDGPHSQWEEVTLNAPTLDNQPDAKIRFRFTSDTSIVDDGWHLDDVTVTGASATCGGEVAPEASFTSTSPDSLGEVTAFSNTSIGTNLSFAWNFGDDSPISNDDNPTHTYAAVGLYTATLTATNSLGSSVFADVVEIEPAAVAPRASFISSSPDWVGATTVFTNTSTGTDLTFIWDFGDGGPISTETHPTHVYAAAGVYTVALTASNSLGSHVFTAQVVIQRQLFLPVIR